MSSALSSLEPALLWNYFEAVCAVPRASKHEDGMRKFLLAFAAAHNLQAKDASGNILILKPATTGMEDRPCVALQAHMDMVCEKNAGVEHNFATDPIVPVVSGDWVRAQGTTLGADDGIGVAAMLAVLSDESLTHGPLECLFTFDEETGLSGAKCLPQGLLKAKRLFNLDSEDDGVFCIGCAGGVDTVGTLCCGVEPAPQGLYWFKVSITGLLGGHSGSDINKNRANAIKLLARFLLQVNNETPIHLADIGGGNLRNAIPREAWAVVGVPYASKEESRVVCNTLTADFRAEYPLEAALACDVESADVPGTTFSAEDSLRIVHCLMAVPHGVLGMCQDIPGLVETSTNLASVHTEAAASGTSSRNIVIVTSQRSSVQSRKEEATLSVSSALRLAGATTQSGEGYPGWKPNVHSQAKEALSRAYKRLFNQEPRVEAIHAGLECGLFLDKYPGLDMVSFGPTLQGVHSPAERVLAPTVAKFYSLLCAVLNED